jgi:hypothetical protein
MATLLTLEDDIANELALSANSEVDRETFNPFSQVERVKAQEISIATDIPLDQVEAERQAGDPRAETAAKTNALNFDYALTIDQAYNDGLSAEEVAEIIEERKAKGDDMTLSEYFLIQNLMLSDNGVNSYAARTLTNMEVWNRLLQKELEANDQSGMSKVMSFLDVNVLRELTIGAFENVTFRSNREGKDIREAFNNLKPAEFEEWAKDYIEERKSEGIFSEDSIWNLYKAANDATYLGDDPMAGVNAMFGVVDIAALGSLSATKSILKGAKTLTQETTTIPNKIAGIYKSRRPIDSVAVMSDESTAGVVATRQVDEVGAQTDEIAAGRTLPEELDPVGSPVSRPSGVTTRQGSRKTVLTEKLEEMNRAGSFGEYIPRTSLEAVATNIAAKIATSVNDVVVNSRRVIDEGSDDFKVVVRLGKDGTGSAFRRKMDAEAVAKQDPSLKVVKREEGRGWFVEAEERVNVLGLPDELDRFDKGNFVSDAINKVFGASTVRLGDKLGGKFLQAEAGQALIGDLVKPYQKIIRAVKGKELQNLSDFMTQLRDGELSYMRQAPTRESFESLYTTMYGTRPKRSTVDAYEALQDINDTTWQIKSSERLKRTVAEGGVYVNITEQYGDIGYRVSNVPDNEFILDLASGKSRKSTSKSLNPDTPVFKIPNTFLDHLYVTNVDSVRVLERVDVMPYNVGGPRTNSEFRYFVGTVREQKLVSGNTISAGFKTLLGSFGQKQATIAVNQINAITRKVKTLMDEMNVADIENLRLSQAQYDELGDIIRANNDWNKHIVDLEDLQRLARDYNFRFTEQFVPKARDQKVSIRESGEDPAKVNATFGEVVGVRQNMKRGDTPLMEFGGKKATNASPISNIADQFGSEAFGYANRAASQTAMVSWVKLAEKAEGLVTFPRGVPENDFYNRFMQAEVTKTGKFNDLAAQLREQQEIIKRRMNQSTWLSDKWDSFTSSATEAIFETTGKKLDLTKTDPASRLLQVGFYSKFGFFNPDQLVLQALHSLTITGISPRQGLKAMGLVSPMFVIANLRDSATRSLAIQRLANFSKIEVEELNKLVKYIDESGRNIIDNQVIELQAPQKFGASSTLAGKGQEAVGKFLDTSTLFFREGERVSRLVGLMTAFLEHRAKRPNIDPLSPEGKLWITNREQDLTFRMTTQSRSFVQSGPMRVPTQWLTFSLRAMENIVIGRNFSVGERTRMFLVMGPMFGLTGIGAGRMAGYFTEQLGFDSSDPQAIETHNRIKYGLIDALLSNLLGTETAYAQRVAPLGQIQDTYRKLFDESLLTTLFGPSGEISKDMGVVAVNAIKAMMGGRTEMVREDLTQLVRNLSSVDKYVKIRELIESGNYRSRTRKLVVSNLDPEAAAAVLFGATPAPVQNYYDYQEMIFKKNNRYRDMSKRLKSKATLALSLLTEGNESDMIRGTKLWEEINDEIWSSSLSNSLKLELQRSLVRVAAVPDIMRNAMRLGLEFDAQLLNEQVR